MNGTKKISTFDKKVLKHDLCRKKKKNYSSQRKKIRDTQSDL